MENPVCALVEKQFVTTFPGAVSRVPTHRRVFTYAGRDERAARAWEDGRGLHVVTSGCGGSPWWPLCAWPYTTELPPPRPAVS